MGVGGEHEPGGEAEGEADSSLSGDPDAGFYPGAL